ncbi:sigma-54 dependent transcriptional regulator [Pollutibacter soli]|uniref:sigma-54-dependent transcriptional regulator n=1 Tax=Pollutibacter soli TaxID=3034157 RepID=UPI003013B7C2
MPTSILLIDDEAPIRNMLGRLIGLEGFEVKHADSLQDARKQLKLWEPDIVLCDVRLPDGSGVDFVNEIKSIYPSAEVILLTAYGNLPDGITAIKNGAFDYILKGDDNNRIIPLLHRAVEKRALANRVLQLEKQVGLKYSFEAIIGKSEKLLRAIELAKKVAPTDTTVLLLGETGTGKEVFAQAIHNASVRSKQNFVAVNCAAFSKELLENELFGHKAGSYTGAAKDQKGLFEEATKGTLFLDEIGEMQADLQSKLLRVLETGEFLRIGDTRPTKVDVRIIAATHRHLREEIDAGRFRADLFYRLSVFQIDIPPLRERIDDISLLINFFADQFSNKIGKKVSSIDPEFIKALQKYKWRGNIRELKNLMERAVILSENGVISKNDLPGEFKTDLADVYSFELQAAEKIHIAKVLAHTQGNKSEAARLLNIGLTTLYRKMEEYHLK